jgi:hypothetical protein
MESEPDPGETSKPDHLVNSILGFREVQEIERYLDGVVLPVPSG